MAMNPMQQQMSPDMLMAMMTDPRASPQQRMAAMSALNAMKGGANAPAPPPQMTGDSTGVSTIDPAFMAAVRQEVMGQGPEAQPEIAQRQAAPEAQQDPTTQALMSGAADASRVAAMARGGEVRGYKDGEEVKGGRPSLSDIFEEEEYPYLNDYFRGPSRLAGVFPPRAVGPTALAAAPLPEEPPPQESMPTPQEEPMPPLRDVMRRPPAPMQRFDVQLPPAPEVNIDQAAEQEKPARSGGKDYYALLEKMAEEGDDGEASKKDKYMALLQAGLGTMAAASQPGAKFLGSIGQGGLMGVEGLQQARAARAQDRMKKMTLYGTLAGRQDASEDRAATLAQAKLLAEEKLRSDREQFERADATDRLIAQGQIAATNNAANLQSASRAEMADFKKEQYKNRPLDTATSRIVNPALDMVEESRNSASRYLELSKKIGDVKPTEGFGGNIKEWAKKTAGVEDLESSIKNDFGQIVKEAQLSRLPRGPASDKDIKFVEAYMLNPSSNNEEKMRFLQTLANLKTDLANRKEFEADFAEKQFRSGQEGFSAGGLDFAGGVTKAEAFKAWNEANPYTSSLPEPVAAGPGVFKTDDEDFNKRAAQYSRPPGR